VEYRSVGIVEKGEGRRKGGDGEMIRSESYQRAVAESAFET